MSVYSMTGFASATRRRRRDAHDAATRRSAPRGDRRSCARSTAASSTWRFRLPDELRGAGAGAARAARRRLQARQDRVARGHRSATADGAWPQPQPDQLNRLSRLESTVQGWLPQGAAAVGATRCCTGAARAAPPSGWTKPRWPPPARRIERPARGPRARRRAPGDDPDGAHRPPARTGRRRPSRWCRPWCSASSSASWSAGTKRWQHARRRRQHPGRGAARARAERGRGLRDAHRRGRGTGAAARPPRRDRRACCKAGGELGKRLDFLIQELQREANTLGTKSAALELTNDLGGDEGARSSRCASRCRTSSEGSRGLLTPPSGRKVQRLRGLSVSGG